MNKNCLLLAAILTSTLACSKAQAGCRESFLKVLGAPLSVSKKLWTPAHQALENAAPSLPLNQLMNAFASSQNSLLDITQACKGQIVCAHEKISGFLDRHFLTKLSAIKGSHLRTTPTCMSNFKKNLGLAWGFQLSGYGMDSLTRSKGGEAPQDFPIDILANTALLIWIQQEISCRQTHVPKEAETQAIGSVKELFKRALRVERKAVTDYLTVMGRRTRQLLTQTPFGLLRYTTLPAEAAIRQGVGEPRESAVLATKDIYHRILEGYGPAVRSYFAESWGRFRELLYTIPFGLMTYTTLATTEDAVRRQVEISQDGESSRPEVFSPNYLSQFGEHAFFISSFEAVLFWRLSYVNAPLELKLLPALQGAVQTGVGKAVLATGEWTYRVGFGFVDGWIVNWWKDESQQVLEGLSWDPEIQEALDETRLEVLEK